MATHSSVLAWRIPGTGEPGGLPSMGSQSRTRPKQLSNSNPHPLHPLRVLPALVRMWVSSAHGPLTFAPCAYQEASGEKSVEDNLC